MNDAALEVLFVVHSLEGDEIGEEHVAQLVLLVWIRIEELGIKGLIVLLGDLAEATDVKDRVTIGILVHELFIEGKEFKEHLVELIPYQVDLI